MLLTSLSLAFAAAPVLTGALPSPPSLLVERQLPSASGSSTTLSNASLPSDSALQQGELTPSSNFSAVLADLSILNALPFPFEGRIGFNNATLFNVVLPAEAASNTSTATVEAARGELEKNGNATVVAYDPTFLEVAGNATLYKVFEGGDYRSSFPLFPAFFLLIFPFFALSSSVL
jgi:hypothetical protein